MTDLLLAHDFPPIGGGIARWMTELARRYPPGELVVSTGHMPGANDTWTSAVVDRVPVASARLKTLPGLWAWQRRARDLARRHQVGFVWCDTVRPAGYVAREARRRERIPYGIMLHGGDLLQLQAKYRRSRLKALSARALLGGATVLAANSAWTADLAAAVFDELRLPVEDRIRAVPLGTDVDRFRPEADPGPFLARYGLPTGRYLLTVARLVPHKGIDSTIEALALLGPAFADVRYLVVGRGSDAPRLHQLALARGVADRIVWLDQVADDELPAAYRAATVYAGLSRAEGLDIEGFGIALMDAAAAAIPVVAGASGGTAEAVRHEETGFRVPPQDLPAAVAAIGRLLDDPVLAARFGAAGRSWAVSERNWERTVMLLRELSRAGASAGRP
ncbi:MAG: glycosyltransferase family 4 protein [Gemmatimonadales bacterium]|nr:glycosyltransferase family 4 protein [Gemmatimonadales bacterium]